MHYVDLEAVALSHDNAQEAEKWGVSLEFRPGIQGPTERRGWLERVGIGPQSFNVNRGGVNQ